MTYRGPRRPFRPQWAVIGPLLATLVFWCAVAAGVHRVLSPSPKVEQADNAQPLVGAARQPPTTRPE